MKKKKEAKKKR